jgi:hypothetical protein
MLPLDGGMCTGVHMYFVHGHNWTVFSCDMEVGCKELFPFNLVHINTGLIFSFFKPVWVDMSTFQLLDTITFLLTNLTLWKINMALVTIMLFILVIRLSLVLPGSATNLWLTIRFFRTEGR